MIKETVQAVGVTHIVTETGSKTLLGNRQFDVGDSVWTHGDYAFGTERNSSCIIIPTGTMLPAEPGVFIVEFNKSNSVFSIRDTATLEVVAEVAMPTDIANSWPPKFCYDGETLIFYAISDGPSSQSYEGATIHKVENGVYTTEAISFPQGGYFMNITCRVENHELHWSAFVNTLTYNKYTKFNGTYYENVRGVCAIYDYVGTSLQNSHDYTEDITTECDLAWNTVNNQMNSADIVVTTTPNGNQSEPFYPDLYPKNPTQAEYVLLKDFVSNYYRIPVFNNESNYDITSYCPQRPRINKVNVDLISFENKNISVIIDVSCYLFVCGKVVYGNRDWLTEKSNYVLTSSAIGYHVGDGNFVLTDANALVCYPHARGKLKYSKAYLYDGSKKVIKNASNCIINSPTLTDVNYKFVADGANFRMHYADVTVSFTGTNVDIVTPQNDSWEQPLDYGYYLNVSAEYGIGTTSNDWYLADDFGAVLTDGTWSYDIGAEFGYNPINYPDFMSLDPDGNILYYTCSYGQLYKIDKATSTKTYVFGDGLYSQMQMQYIEKTQDEIVSALTVNNN